MNRKLLPLAIVLILAAACSNADLLNVNPSSQNVSSEAGSTTFKIVSDAGWTVSCGSSWLNISPASGTGDGILSASYEENTLASSRTANISVIGSGGKNTVYITVVQAAKSENVVEISWIQKTDLPTARGWLSPSACVVEGLIYVIGGFSEGEIFDKVEVYDPDTDSWSEKSPLLTGRWGNSSDVFEGKIYVMGGQDVATGDALSSIEIYDPSSDTWSSGGSMPFARVGFGSCVTDGRIYVIGGRVADPGADFLASVEAFDPVSDTWAAKSPMPAPRGYLAVTARNGKIYAIGGTNVSGIPENTVFKYDVATDVWTETTSLHYKKWGLSSCLAGNMIICTGGFKSGADPGQNTVEVIMEQEDETIKATSISFNRGVSSVCYLDGKIYVMGGINTVSFAGGCSYNEEGLIELK